MFVNINGAIPTINYVNTINLNLNNSNRMANSSKLSYYDFADNVIRIFYYLFVVNTQSFNRKDVFLNFQ